MRQIPQSKVNPAGAAVMCDIVLWAQDEESNEREPVLPRILGGFTEGSVVADCGSVWSASARKLRSVGSDALRISCILIQKTTASP